MISILDLNIGNIRSLGNCIEYLGLKFKIIKTSKEIDKSKILIIPGVGSFDFAMNTIKKNKLKESIIDFVKIKKKPLLGICIGMQILFELSEEGKEPGLGILNGNIKKLKKYKNYKVPHVGYSEVELFKSSGIFKEIENNLSFYFTNSYGLKFMKNNYFENYCYVKHKFNFIGAFQKENISGIQFHPELSHTSGLIVLKNFFNPIL